MNATFLSDTHSRHNRVTLPGGDILFYCGDIMTNGYHVDEIQSFLDWILKQDYKYKVIIPGNHDRYAEDFLSQVKDMFEQHYDEGVRYLIDEETNIEGLRIYGTPYQPYFCDWAFNLPDEEDSLNYKYALIPEGIDVLLTHCPPYDILDRSHYAMPMRNRTGEEPLGSKSLRNRLDAMSNKPRYVAFGHIHGDGGKTLEKDGVTYINCSVANEAYEMKNTIVNLTI